MLEETEVEAQATPDGAIEEPIIKQPSPQDVQAAWEKMREDNPWFQTLHLCQHTYMFSLNANHTVVRGCIHCGETHASFVMGSPDDLIWHRIQEPEQGGED